MRPPSHMRSVVDLNDVMRRIPVHKPFHDSCRLTLINTSENKEQKLAFFFFTKHYKFQFYVMCKNCTPKKGDCGVPFPHG